MKLLSLIAAAVRGTALAGEGYIIEAALRRGAGKRLQRLC